MLPFRASEHEVMSVPEPEWTQSWHPVSHARIIQALEIAIKDTGMNIIDRRYTLGADGANVFGAWTLDREEDGIRWMSGFRNSLKKDFALGMVGGNYVMVCSNMQFNGDDFIEFRRHTKGLDWDELIEMSKRSFQGLIVKMQKLTEWHKELRERNMSDNDFKMLTFDAMKADVFPPQQFPKFLDCFNEEKKIASDQTLFQFNGAVTRLVKDQSLFLISNRTTKLMGTLKGFIDKHPILKKRKGE